MEKIKHQLKKLSKYFSKKPNPNSLEGIYLKSIGRWKKDGAEKTRYICDLNEDSVVFDMGGYEGQFAGEIYARYRSKIHVFEPVKEFAKNITEKFSKNPDITVYAFGLSDRTEDVSLSLNENSTSQYLEGSDTEKVKMLKASDFLFDKKITSIDLMKINIEGGEYPLLENLIANNFLKNIKTFQIQFHTFVPYAQKRMEDIQKELSKTHHLTYEYPFVWENWERNK